MNYLEVMRTLSQCGLGAAVIDADTTILSVNEAGDRLLHGNGKLLGKRLSGLAEALCLSADKPQYARVAFSEYVTLCPTPDADDLPPNTRMVVFRNATSDACHDLLMNAINQFDDGIILCDADTRVWMLNDSAIKMDALLVEDVKGEHIEDVYFDSTGDELLVPRTIRNKRPLINQRQRYTTRFGREVDIMCSSYPVIQNGQVIGGYSIMKDWSTIDDLSKKIIDLQEKLMERNSKTGNKNKNVLGAKYTFRDIVHSSSQMHTIIEQCRQAARTGSSVMIHGETGTGKELFAQSIHNASGRVDRPFLAINCAAIPENLLESLLFGTEKGAYTGAEQRPGLFEQADGGTLLLDEINSMNIALQAKLLRVLQEGTIRRVGGTQEIQVDVRVLSNINIPPYQAIAENKLRSDLFYRLGVVNINVPALRDRREDIPLLAKTFLMQCNKKMGRNVRSIDAGVLSYFHEYDWPGNVRELQHAIEHAMNVLPDGVAVIAPEHIPEHIRSHRAEDHARRISIAPVLPESPRIAAPYETENRYPVGNTIRDMERQTICNVLRETGGNISAAARRLNISRQNLQYRLKKYKIDVNTL
ncbi:MAG: sigma 54-interacting transcriptional regulator [Butyricicoccus sp.]|nr:sigma 54-interacting transcriptional regulator [Butyricicoccus sp.]MBQ8586126.1 sigma 54-interacting transcriptional regulator [Butyricicoccus sp.]